MSVHGVPGQSVDPSKPSNPAAGAVTLRRWLTHIVNQAFGIVGAPKRTHSHTAISTGPARLQLEL